MIATMNWDIIWEGIIVAAFTSALTGAFSFFKWIQPRRKLKEEKERQLEVGWFGRAGIPGVSQDVIAMPLRMDGVERGLTQVRDSVDTMSGTMDKLETAVTESNGFVKEVKTMVTGLSARLPGATAAEVNSAFEAAAKTSTDNAGRILTALDEHDENGHGV